MLYEKDVDTQVAALEANLAAEVQMRVDAEQTLDQESRDFASDGYTQLVSCASCCLRRTWTYRWLRWRGSWPQRQRRGWILSRRWTRKAETSLQMAILSSSPVHHAV